MAMMKACGLTPELLIAALDDAAADAPARYRPTPATSWSVREVAAYLMAYDTAHAAWSAAAATKRSRKWTEIGQMAVERIAS
jgi:hypothetical protein